MNETVPPDIDGNPSDSRFKTHGLLGRLVNQQTSSLPPANEAATANVPDSDNTAANAFALDNHAVTHNGVTTLPVQDRNALAVDETMFPRHGSGPVSTLSAQLGSTSSPQEEKSRSDLVSTSKPNGKSANNQPNNNNNANKNDNGSDDHDYNAGRQGSSQDGKPKKRTFFQELKRSFWLVVTHTWLNVLLVFVPVGLIVANVGIDARVVFAINCVAIIPLAGLLSFATESVARKMGDALGALLNVTFGNAVELIIFIIALAKNQIRIVQASLLGSILANLLLILGMGFFLGGLRYREQVRQDSSLYLHVPLLTASLGL